MSHTFKVQGMMCNGCATTVKNALADLKKIDTLEVDHQNDSVCIDGNINIAQIEQLLTNAGFPTQHIDS